MGMRSGSAQRIHDLIQRGDIGTNIGFKTHFTASAQHRHPVVTDGSAQNNGISRLRFFASRLEIINDPTDTAGVDKYSVTLAVFDDFGITGDDLNSGFFRTFPHRCQYFFKVRKGEAFFQNKSRG